MTAFQWSSEDTIIFQSAIMGSIGILSITFALAYVFFKLGKKYVSRMSYFSCHKDLAARILEASRILYFI